MVRGSERACVADRVDGFEDAAHLKDVRTRVVIAVAGDGLSRNLGPPRAVDTRRSER
jgi:hypothetical protein